MNKNLKVAAIGTSSIMETAQEALHQVPGWQSQVVLSRNLERGRAFAERNDIAEVMDNQAAAFARQDIDVVYIASPNKLHFEQVTAALQAGKHVVVEKPTSVTEAETAAIIETAKSKSVYFFEAVTTLFMPNFLEFKRNLPFIGTIKNATITYGQLSSKYNDYLAGMNPSNFSTEMQGGALNDLGIYCIHTALALFGEPQSVDYTAERGPNGVDTYGCLELAYDTFNCTIYVAKDRDLPSSCVVEGSDGSLRQSGPINSFDDCTWDKGGAVVDCSVQNAALNRMRYEFVRFRDAINENDSAFFLQMAQQSLVASRILEQAHKSAANK